MNLAPHEHKLKQVVDADGKSVAVVVPIELWREITSALETAYLQDDPVLMERVRNPSAPEQGIPLEQVVRRAGLGKDEAA